MAMLHRLYTWQSFTGSTHGYVLDVLLDDVIPAQAGWQLAGLVQGKQGLIGEVGADGISTITHQRAELVHLTSLKARVGTPSSNINGY